MISLDGQLAEMSLLSVSIINPATTSPRRLRRFRQPLNYDPPIADQTYQIIGLPVFRMSSSEVLLLVVTMVEHF
jgi:hypothetical protein